MSDLVFKPFFDCKVGNGDHFRFMVATDGSKVTRRLIVEISEAKSYTGSKLKFGWYIEANYLKCDHINTVVMEEVNSKYKRSLEEIMLSE